MPRNYHCIMEKLLKGPPSAEHRVKLTLHMQDILLHERGDHSVNAMKLKFPVISLLSSEKKTHNYKLLQVICPECSCSALGSCIMYYI